MVWKVDRLARSLHHLIEMALRLDGRGLHLKVLTMDIDTRTPGGKALYQMAGVFAEFEREIIRERTRAGLDAAKGRGVKLGRPRKLTDDKLAVARELLAGDRSVAEVARTLRVSQAVLYDALAKTGSSLA